MIKMKIVARPALSVMILALLAITAGCSGKEATAPKKDKLIVVTSIFPVADIIRNVGGKRIEVIALVQPGQSPHTYEPLPREMELMSRADVFATVGFGLEFWADKMLANAQNPKLIKLVYADYVKPVGSADEHEGKYNPHIWLSPKIAMVMAEKTRDALSRAMPAAAPEFAANCEAYTKELKRLDAWTISRLSKLKNRKFVSFHSAWDYLSRDYGIVQAGSIEEFPGKEPTPEKLARLVEETRKLRVKTIFAEPQFNPKVAETLANEAGVSVATLDPMGDPNTPDRNTYIKLMEYNIKSLEKALK
ncbi:MAG: metal ABC transporter substrate-binding protein [bacterium]